MLLYQHGVKLDQLGMHRETCLHLAARQAREDVLGKLLIMLNDTPDGTLGKVHTTTEVAVKHNAFQAKPI